MMEEITMEKVTIEAHRVAEEVVAREIHTAALEMEKVVYEILEKKLGSTHDEDHIWIRVRREDSEKLRDQATGWLTRTALNTLSYLLVAGIVYLVVILSSNNGVNGVH